MHVRFQGKKFDFNCLIYRRMLTINVQTWLEFPLSWQTSAASRLANVVRELLFRFKLSKFAKLALNL